MPAEAKFIPKFLKIYSDRFRYPPVFVRKDKDIGLVYRFKGVNPVLELWVKSDDDCEIFYKDIPKNCSFYFTNLFTMSSVVKYEKNKGFYCELCLPEYRKYYKDKESFYLEHTFKLLVEWCNKNFSSENYLYVYQKKGGLSVLIKSAKEIYEIEDITSYKIEPVVGYAPILDTYNVTL